MAEPLNGSEAYCAALLDLGQAQRLAEYAVRNRLVPRSDFDRIVRDELEHLLSGRIQRGELPPLRKPCSGTQSLYNDPLRKAS
jgi:hypothetical protein